MNIEDFINTTSPNQYYIDLDLDFHISPRNFLEWLVINNDENFSNVYARDVVSKCFQAVYFIYLRAKIDNFDLSRLKHCHGYYSNFDHHWILLDNRYIIDLTLKQFEIDAPKLAIIDTERCETNYVTSTERRLNYEFNQGES